MFHYNSENKKELNTKENNDQEEFSNRARYIKKRDTMQRNESCAESLYSTIGGVSTRGDCTSFEYSEYGEQSVNYSQSFMDETNGPALLAFVEDYILGQRLEMIDSIDSDDDIASSSSSSYGSDTFFSTEESMIKTNKSEDNKLAVTNVECENIESIQQTSMKKSRWESLLQSISATKRKIPKQSQGNHSIMLLENNEEVAPSRARFLAAIKAKMVTKETSTTLENNSAKPSAIVAVPPIEPNLEKVDKPDTYITGLKRLHHIKVQAEKLGLQKFDRTSSFMNSSELTSSRVCVGRMESQGMEMYCDDKAASSSTTNNIPTSNQQPSMTNSPNDAITLEICEGIEIPNVPDSKSSPSRNSVDRASTLERKLIQNLAISSKEVTCDDTSNVFTTVKDQGKTPLKRKAILCSRCREALTDKSICSLLSRDSLLCHEVSTYVDPLQKDIIDDSAPLPCIPDQNIEQLVDQYVNNNMETENVMDDIECPTKNVSNQLDSIKEIEEEDDISPIEVSEHILTTMSINVNTEAKDQTTQETMEETKPSADCLSNKIETTITCQNVKPEIKAIQIEFKDWAGNDVEIVQESPKKKRLPWIHDVLSSTMTPVHDESKVQTSAAKQEENTYGEHFEVTQEIFPSSATVCNIETTALAVEKTSPQKSRYFGLIKQKPSFEHRKDVLLSPAMLSKSTSECKDDEARKNMYQFFDTTNNSITKSETVENPMLESTTECVNDDESLGNTECCLESTATSVTSRVVNKGSDKRETKSVDDCFEGTDHTTVTSEVVVRDTDEAFLLERAMQQVNSEAKFERLNVNTRKHMSSPVTLYRFLDYDPCRYELAHENSYDMIYDPIGLSVCQLPQVGILTDKCAGKKTGENFELETDSNSIIYDEPLLEQPKRAGSSLKKVFRRLKQPKVAFRENLVDVYSKESEPKLSFLSPIEANNVPKPPILIYEAVSPTGRTSSKNEELRDIEAKKIAKDKIKMLLKETKRKHAGAGASSDKLDNASSQKSILSASKILSALKAEYRAKRNGNKDTTKSSQVLKDLSSYKSNGSMSPKSKANKARKIDMMKSKLHAANILDKFKKAQATGMLRSDSTTYDKGNNNISTVKDASDATVITIGTKHSTLSHASKLTIEERKLADRLMSDIKLLALIEKKRESMGQIKSSLKSSDINKSVQILKSIEASRKNRSDITKQSTTSTTNNDSKRKQSSAVAKISMLSDITSTNNINN